MSDLRSRREIIKRRQNKSRNTPVVTDQRQIGLPDPNTDEQIREIWDNLRALSNNATKSVKEADLKYGRNHKLRTGTLSGKVGQFRIKEVSDIAQPETLEICGQKSWNKLSAQLPDLTEFKVKDDFAVGAGETFTNAELATRIGELAGKIDLILIKLSNLDTFALKEIPDENPNVDFNALGKSLVEGAE